MTDLSPDNVLAVFLIFCRIGACLLIIPGFSSNHVPVKVRLFIAIVNCAMYRWHALVFSGRFAQFRTPSGELRNAGKS